MMSSKKNSHGFKPIYYLLLVILLCITVPYIIWVFMPTTRLSIFVVDKTVGKNYREHSSFFWLLNHWKITKSESNTFYDASKDYYGFFLHDSSFSDQSKFDIFDKDLVYITDTYGIYQYPMEYEMYERLIPTTYIPAKLIYGGVTAHEMETLQKYDSLGGTIIAEFNTLQEPTWTSSKIERDLEKMFNIDYDAVLGKYYENLETAAIMVKDLYKVQTKKEWNFTGRGVIITDGRFGKANLPKVIVLDSKDLFHTPVFLRSINHPMMNGVADAVPYYYFFEFLHVDSTATVLANYEIECTESGKEKLHSSGLPLVFPAVVASDSSMRKIYFAGDFVDNEVQTQLQKYWGVERLLTQLYFFYFVSDQTRFFWRFYVPMMNNILEHVQQHSIQKKK